MKLHKIKILHIIPRFTTGGAERLVLQYAHLLDKEKFDIAVASTVEDGNLRELFEKESITLFVGSRLRDGGRLGVALKLRKFVKKFKPDIIHTHLFGADLFGWYFKIVERLPVKWISTQHNVEYKTAWIRRYVWKHIVRQADSVIAVADKVKTYDREQFGLKDAQVQVLKNGIDIESLSSVSQTIGKQKEWQLGIVGRLEKQKGHVYLFNALSNLQKYSWHMHVYGDGSGKEYLQKVAEEKGIGARITWHGVVSNTSRIYGSCDIIIQPSLWEGLSLVVMEALCAGRFVIASIPAGEELIEDKKTGMLVRAGNADDIARALAYSFEQVQEIQTIAHNARVYALAHFDIRDKVKKLESFYTCL